MEQIKYHLTEEAKHELYVQSFTFTKNKEDIEKYVEEQFNKGNLDIVIPDKWVIGANKYMKPVVFVEPSMFEMEPFAPDYGVWYDFECCKDHVILAEWDYIIYRTIDGQVTTDKNTPNIIEFTVIQDVPF